MKSLDRPFFVNTNHHHHHPHEDSDQNSSDPAKNGPACLIKGNLHLASCLCWSHFWFHGERVAPPHFSGHDRSDCEMILSFEGIFVRSSHKQMVCMLGCADRPFMMPKNSSSSDIPQYEQELHLYPKCAQGHGCKEGIRYAPPRIPTIRDCEISLQLVYPSKLTIRTFSTLRHNFKLEEKNRSPLL